MAYFNQDFVDFFKGLAANNHKDYFDQNRKVYLKQVKEPFYQLVADCIEEIGKIDSKVKGLEVKNSVFRINRDIRFSKDKTPYNLHVSAAIGPNGRKNMEYPGLYLHLNIDQCHFGGGCYQPSKENLSRMRQFIIDHPKKVDAALKDSAFKKVYGALADGDKNKVLPKEFKAYGEEYPLLYNKQFYYMTKHNDGDKVILKDDLLPFIIDHYKAGQSWNKVLKTVLK
jgi:uncharacterized protein (TIGR02453 family)